MANRFIITCDEATTICDKNQYGEATLLEKMKLSFHVLFCKWCKTYSKQNGLVSKLCGKYLEQHEHAHLNEAEKTALKERLSKEIE